MQLSHVVEANQVFSLIRNSLGVKLQQGMPAEDDFLPGTVVNPVWIQTENPESPYYCTAVSNASLLTRKAYPETQFKGLARRLDTAQGVQYEWVERELHDARGIEVTIKITDNTQTVFSLPESALVIDTLGNYVFTQDTLNVLTVWEPSFASSSQTRKGEIVCKRRDVSYFDYLKQIGFDIRAFEVEKDGRITIKSVDKMSKRVKQTASSSTGRTFLKGFKFVSEAKVPYELHGQTVEGTLITMKNNKGVLAEGLILPDFEVEQEVMTYLPMFSSKGIAIQRRTQLIRKKVTDGSHYFDYEFAKRYGFADEFGQLRFVEQFRGGPAIKGLAVMIPGFRRQLDVDFILFEGGIKGDAVVSFKTGNLDFAVLNRGREEEVCPGVKFSRQITSAIQNEAMVQGLTDDTKELIEKVLNFDPVALEQFLNIKDTDPDEVDLDVDQLTTALYSVGRATFLKSYTLRKKMLDLASSALQQFANGSRLYAKDSKFAFMLSDPFAVMFYLRQGILGAKKADVTDYVGIKPDHVLSPELRLEGGEEVFRINTDRLALFRFPFLHSTEARVVNPTRDLFHNAESKRWYEGLVLSGFIQGVVIYSIWDMNAEGQSGADYDGDLTVATKNPHIVNNLNSSDLFLDYSIIEQTDGTQTILDGCPFPGSDFDLASLLRPAELEWMKEHDVMLSRGGISGPAELSNTPDWVNLVAGLSARVARATLVGNDIGRLTNISLTISHIVSALKTTYSQLLAVTDLDVEPAASAIRQEITGYNKLNMLLAVAIRWEVDKAKHGGAYMKEMPFLEALLGKVELDELVELENKYGISLQRLVLGVKSH